MYISMYVCVCSSISKCMCGFVRVSAFMHLQCIARRYVRLRSYVICAHNLNLQNFLLFLLLFVYCYCANLSAYVLLISEPPFSLFLSLLSFASSFHFVFVWGNSKAGKNHFFCLDLPKIVAFQRSFNQRAGGRERECLSVHKETIEFEISLRIRTFSGRFSIPKFISRSFHKKKKQKRSIVREIDSYSDIWLIISLEV